MSGFYISYSLCLRLKRLNGYKRLASSFLFKLYNTVYLGMQGMVLTCVHVFTRIVFGSSLSNDNVSRYRSLTSKNLYA